MSKYSKVVLEYERFTPNQLIRRLGEISSDDVASTQNALIILCGIIQDQANEIVKLREKIALHEMDHAKDLLPF